MPHGDNISMSFQHVSDSGDGEVAPRRIKQFMQQLRFRQKMQVINRKKGKYKRSTNNCHKKYIGILKNLLFLKLPAGRKERILAQYSQYKNSRVYYFIILAQLKWTVGEADIRWVFEHFCREVEGKMERYRLEISTTNNGNFIHFRKDEIIEMEYSIQAVNHFLRGDATEAIRVLYQKNKSIIIKRNQYLRTLEIVRELEGQLARETGQQPQDIANKLQALTLHEVFRWERNVDFNQIESIERLSMRRAQEVRADQQESEEEEEGEGEGDGEEGVRPIKEEANESGRSEQLLPHHPQEGERNLPLLQLQNSFRVVTDLDWHSWVIQRQKMMEFTIKHREDRIKRAAEAFIRARTHP